MDPNIPVNIAALPYWVTAAISAALYFCFKGNYHTTEAEPPKISGPNYVTVLTAALGISTGKIIFKWIPRVIVSKLSLNKEVITNLNNINLPPAGLVNQTINSHCGCGGGGGGIRTVPSNCQCWPDSFFACLITEGDCNTDFTCTPTNFYKTCHTC